MTFLGEPQHVAPQVRVSVRTKGRTRARINYQDSIFGIVFTLTFMILKGYVRLVRQSTQSVKARAATVMHV